MNRHHFDELIIRADDGDFNAMNELHNLYYDNEQVFRNYDRKSLQFCKDNITENRPYLLYHIAILEFFINDDRDIAFYYLNASMQADCSQAFYMMAVLISEKVFDHILDYDTLMMVAMKMGNSNALLDTGIECDDLEVKVALLEKAANLENSHSMRVLGDFYLSINEFGIAIQYYERSCTYDNKCAYYSLAIMYSEGKGIGKNNKIAKRLLKKSIKFDNSDALIYIGDIYRCEKNYEKCKKYYKMAISKNHPNACYSMGNMYIEKNNMRNAIKFFVLGAKLGDRDSMGMALKYGVMTAMEVIKLQKFHEEFLVVGY